jgi:hypothetical protein
MRRIDCIDGLEYDTVVFRNELADLIRHETKSRVDYIRSVFIDHDGVYFVSYACGNSMIQYSTKYGSSASKISVFTRTKERNNKLNELGI